LYRVNDELQVVEFPDQRGTQILDRAVHLGVVIRAGKEYDSVAEPGHPLHQVLVERQAVHPRHDHVTNDGGGSFGFQPVERLICRFRLYHGVPGALEHQPQHPPHRGVVIDDKNSGHAGIWAASVDGAARVEGQLCLMAMIGITYQTTSEDVASRSLQVTVDPDRLEATERRAVREYARKARLPGFRKGHAPEPMVRRRFEAEIRRFVLEEALRESWDAILKETDLKPTADPQIRNVSFENGKPLTFEMLIEVRPQITLSKTGGFALTRRIPAITDEMVGEQLQQLREQRGSWNPLTGVRAKPGNLVSVTVTTLEEGAEPVTGQPHDLVLGQGQAIPELEQRIMELLPGGTVDAEVRFPDDHPDESRRGKTRNVRIALHEVKEQLLPELDDALARELGDFDSLASLEAGVHKDLATEATRRADDELHGELLRQVGEANDVPAPPSMVHRLLHAYAESYRVEAAQFETFAKSFQPVAEAQVKRELILDAVATAQNLRATEADIDGRVATLAGSRGLDPAKLYTSLQQNKRLGELEHSITEEKVFAWLLQHSTVTEDAA
jgi:trigger factor